MCNLILLGFFVCFNGRSWIYLRMENVQKKMVSMKGNQWSGRRNRTLLFTIHSSILFVLLFFYHELMLLNKLTQIDGGRKNTFFAILTVLGSSLVYCSLAFLPGPIFSSYLYLTAYRGCPNFFLFLVPINSLSVYFFITYLQPTSSNQT